jgi:hypothetical protein
VRLAYIPDKEYLVMARRMRIRIDEKNLYLAKDSPQSLEFPVISQAFKG